ATGSPPRAARQLATLSPNRVTTAHAVVDLAPRPANKTMLIERIYEWARAQPMRQAIVSKDVPVNYAAFSRAIDAARGFLERHALPAGQTAIVLAHSPVHAWTIVLALRSLGLTTVYVTSIKNTERLKLRNVAVVVGFQPELNAHRLE